MTFDQTLHLHNSGTLVIVVRTLNITVKTMQGVTPDYGRSGIAPGFCSSRLWSRGPPPFSDRPRSRVMGSILSGAATPGMRGHATAAWRYAPAAGPGVMSAASNPGDLICRGGGGRGPRGGLRRQQPGAPHARVFWCPLLYGGSSSMGAMMGSGGGGLTGGAHTAHPLRSRLNPRPRRTEDEDAKARRDEPSSEVRSRRHPAAGSSVDDVRHCV